MASVLVTSRRTGMSLTQPAGAPRGGLDYARGMSWPGLRRQASTRSAWAGASGWRSCRRTRRGCWVVLRRSAGSGLVPINFRLEHRRGPLHRRAQRLRCCWSTPSWTSPWPACRHRFVLGTEPTAHARGRRARAVDRPTRTPPPPSTTPRDHGRPKGVQLTHRNLWVNASTFGWHQRRDDRDVVTHTLPMFHCNGWGMPFALTGMGASQQACCARLMARRSCAWWSLRGDPAVRGPRRGGGDPRGPSDWDGPAGTPHGWRRACAPPAPRQRRGGDRAGRSLSRSMA